MEDLRRELAEIKEAVRAIDYAIRGNGVPGLRSEHNSLAERVRGMVVQLRWLIGLVTTIGTGAVVYLLTHTVR